MLELLATYAPMMRWGQDATPSPVPNGWDNYGYYGYNMMGRHLALFNGLMGYGDGWFLWLWTVLCLITWVLINMVLVALFRWLWKKGSK